MTNVSRFKVFLGPRLSDHAVAILGMVADVVIGVAVKWCVMVSLNSLRVPAEDTEHASYSPGSVCSAAR